MDSFFYLFGTKDWSLRKKDPTGPTTHRPRLSRACLGLASLSYLHDETLQFYNPLVFSIRGEMSHIQNDDLEYVVDDYYDMTDFDNEPFSEGSTPKSSSDSPFDSDLEDDFDMGKSKTDTSAVEARNGKDIQGIPWERLNFTRDKYRETRLKQYENYESLSSSRDELEKECKQVEKGHTLYAFEFNTRLVRSTIVHFQISEGSKHSCTCSMCATNLILFCHR
ncbi:hypothetical protein Nepgr_001965 [Nepenthes gracilis]|uniref:Uncharacterized protein n=1 Tax=Nepenthes gracilis TaxID=150966 RepID=A0AAD3RXW7_NEPGR|nr:hypothetical protein Nepgr_001965 [Nepenthes gracilis]